MKILHLINSHGFYGAERVVLELSTQLSKIGHQPIIGCLVNNIAEKPLLAEKSESNGLEVRYIIAKGKISLHSILNIRNVLNEENIDLIHTHGFKATVLGWFAVRGMKVRIIVTCHLWTKETKRLSFYAWVESRFMKFINYVVAVSQKVKEDLIEMGVNPEKIVVIQNGIITETPNLKLNNSQYRKNLGLSEKTKIVGTLGRLAWQKGIHYFLDAAALILKKDTEVEFIIVGDGPLEKELKSYSRSIGLHSKIHFLGFRTDNFELLKLMDVFILSSIDEGLPMVLLEAMAMEIPVVVTSVGGIPEVISTGVDGILVKPRDSVAAAKAIETVLNDGILKKQLVSNAKEKVHTCFSIEAMTKKYVTIYNKTKC